MTFATHHPVAASRRRPGRLLLAAVAALTLGALSVVTAGQAFADPFSFALVSGSPDFGYVKQGNVLTETLTLQNTGDNAITIEPAPIAGLAGPFKATAINFTAATVLKSLERATFTVSFTAPAAGTNPSQVVRLTATDQTDLTTTTVNLIFSGKSVATEPVHFTATPTSGGATIDFGSPVVGTPVSRSVTLLVDGIVPLRFSDGAITIADGSGAAVPELAISGSSFGAGGADYKPGETATLDLTFTPSAARTTSGAIHIVGTQVSVQPVKPTTSADVPFAATAVVLPPTTTPTPTPTPTSTTTTAATVVPPAPGTTGHSAKTSALAETGLPVGGVAALVGLLVVAGAATLVVGRRAAQTRGGSGPKS